MTYEQERHRMVEQQLVARGIRDGAVLDAMRTVPRERFVGPEIVHQSYLDTPLPIEHGQTISQPYVVALMIAALSLRPSHRLLEVGTGSGYAAAVASLIVSEVYTIERNAELAEEARARLADLNMPNVRVRHADGTLGWPDAAPFDAILVSASGPDVPPALREQLVIGGRLVIPVARRRRQRLVRVMRLSEERYWERDLGPVRFVPLVGAAGWSE